VRSVNETSIRDSLFVNRDSLELPVFRSVGAGAWRYPAHIHWNHRCGGNKLFPVIKFGRGWPERRYATCGVPPPEIAVPPVLELT